MVINKSVQQHAFFKNENNLRGNLAIGTLTLFIAIFFLFILNSAVYIFYTPDLKLILDKVLPFTFLQHDSFSPEPVERMQYLLSLLCIPFFVFIAFTVIDKKRNFLHNRSRVASGITIAGIFAVGIYSIVIFKQHLLYVPHKTTRFFFKNNAISKTNLFSLAIFYSVLTYLFLLYSRSAETKRRKMIMNIISYSIVFFMVVDIVLYNVLHVAEQTMMKLMETNAVFYSVTQVYAGKSLLVDINDQYGLYAWFLNPVFKLVGLSTVKFSLVMGVLNGISFSCLFLGIKKLIKNDLFALIVFLTVALWLYWQSRLPLIYTARYFYQYYPIRILFPSISFFLIVVYQTCSIKKKKIILVLLALSASVSVLWNLDTGVVLFGATTIALIYSAIDPLSFRNTMKRTLVYSTYMLSALLCILLLFVVVTRIHAEMWPDFKKLVSFQNTFYISGYYMLPMTLIHFWNFPVIVYLIACIYCTYQLKKAKEWDTPVIVFLFILGAGIFSYFQGRSYDMTIDAVMYPAVILLGVFCSKLIPDIQFKRSQFKFHESYLLFLILFLFFIDSAYSMLHVMPSIHTFSVGNAFVRPSANEGALRQRMVFLDKHLHKKDTVLILAGDFESYYYAHGAYYNPVSIPGSTEMFFKSELYTLLDSIKTSRYHIIYDVSHPLISNDTILKTLKQYTRIEAAMPDSTMLFLKHADLPVININNGMER